MHLHFLNCKLTLAWTIVFAFVFIHLTRKTNHYIMQKLQLLIWKVGREPIFHIIPEIPWNLSSLGDRNSINQLDHWKSLVIHFSWWKYKICIFQTGIGVLEVYLTDYQSLCQLDCLQIIRKRIFSLQNTNLNPNLVCVCVWGGGILPPCWFSLNKSEIVKAVTLVFCSI